MKGITAEQERILVAAKEERLRVNLNGRYEIEGEEPPDRRERERLMNRALLERGWSNPIRLTGLGLEALEIAPRLSSPPPRRSPEPTLLDEAERGERG